MIIFLSLTIGFVAGYLLGVFFEQKNTCTMISDMEDDMYHEMDKLNNYLYELEDKLTALTPVKKVKKVK